MAIYPFPVIYIADLDAIQHQTCNSGIIHAIARNNPGTEFWIDAGNTSPVNTGFPSNLKTVIGSESITETDWQNLQEAAPCSYILSLDFRKNQLCGPEQILDSASSWPDTVITMFLDRVGSSGGPNLSILETINSLAIRSGIVAAGGTRNLLDLKDLQQRGCQGVLVASILHQLELGADAIGSF